jgi:hypothetical protein
MKITDLVAAQTWLPPRIPGTTLWLPGAAITPIGGPITAWGDRSHRNHPLTIGAVKPTYVASAINARPGLLCNGTTQTLECPVPQVTLSYTMLMVMKQTATGGVQGFMTNGGPAAIDGYGFIDNSGNMFVIHDGVGFSAAGPATNTNATIWTATYNALTTTMKLYKNGVLVTTDAAFPNPIPPTSNFTVGTNGGFFGGGTFAELYMADNVISAKDLATLHRYEKAKYNL